MKIDQVDDKVGKVTSYALAFIAGWLACSAYYGTLHLTQKAQTLEQVQTVTIPKLKASAHCESARADKATVVAKKAIVGANSETAQIPSPKEIPGDTCPHPAIK